MNDYDKDDDYQINMTKEEYDLLFDIINDLEYDKLQFQVNDEDTYNVMKRRFDRLKFKVLDPIDLNK